jgi:transposase
MVNVGIDLHKTQFTVCARTEGREWFAEHGTTDAGYRAFLEQAGAWQAAGQEVRVGVESTGNTRYFKSRMEAAGIGVTVINTLKFKVVNESVKKTDKHDAATIAEFLEKDMLPESKLCGRLSEKLRRFLKARTTLVRAAVSIKNQIHALLTAEGMEDTKASLQSKRGRRRVLEALAERGNELVVQPLMETIDRLEENIKRIEEELRRETAGNRLAQLLLTIPGCGEICAWTILAYTDDIARFATAKKYAAYAGLVPWVQNSNATIHHGKITKRGPEELRTALIQVVMGMRRQGKKLEDLRLMEQYDAMKPFKGTGKTVVATARKVAVIIWHMATGDVGFDFSLMTNRKLAAKAESMSAAALHGHTLSADAAALAQEAAAAEPQSSVTKQSMLNNSMPHNKETTGVAGEKRKKAG